MKVILQENVEGLGYLGDVLTVADGYARNFLLPRKKAVLAEERKSSCCSISNDKSIKRPRKKSKP